MNHISTYTLNFSCYDSSFLPSYGGFGPYSSSLPMGPVGVECKPSLVQPGHGIPGHHPASLLYTDCKPPGAYSPLHTGIPPHCV